MVIDELVASNHEQPTQRHLLDATAFQLRQRRRVCLQRDVLCERPVSTTNPTQVAIQRCHRVVVEREKPPRPSDRNARTPPVVGTLRNALRGDPLKPTPVNARAWQNPSRHFPSACRRKRTNSAFAQASTVWSLLLAADERRGAVYRRARRVPITATRRCVPPSSRRYRTPQARVLGRDIRTRALVGQRRCARA